jgi:hypothetical protein
MPIRILFAAITLIALAACSSFNVSSPQQGKVITLPGMVPVEMYGKPEIVGHVEVRDLTANMDYSNQVMQRSADRYSGAFVLPAGQHKIYVAADVSCWYCTGKTYRPSETRSICVTAAGPASGPFKTAFAKDTNLSWSTPMIDVVSTAQSGSNTTRWKFNPASSGFAADTGFLESVEFPCYCMRSTDDKQNTPIGLSACDRDDPLQKWQAFRVGSVVSNKGFYRFQNTGRGISDACLTEGPNGQIVQRTCNDTDDQLWAIQNGTTGQFESGSYAWLP